MNPQTVNDIIYGAVMFLAGAAFATAWHAWRTRAEVRRIIKDVIADLMDGQNKP